MSEFNIGRLAEDKETEKVRNIVFLIAAVAMAIVPFIVYNAFFKTKTEIVFIEKACTEGQFMSNIKKDK